MQTLGDRMKSYEGLSRHYLERKQPVIIRVDGKSFSKYTKGFKKPFDDILVEVMHLTTKFLCANIQNCKIGYTQSDEISLLLVDYHDENTDCWFGNNLQKLCSVSASMATLAFNKHLIKVINQYYDKDLITDDEYAFYMSKTHLAMFDSRAFIVPKEDVVNYFIWRQQDAVRNSIQMLGRSNFPHKKLQNKNTKEIEEMLNTELGISWSDLSIAKKQGVCLYKEKYTLDNKEQTIRHRWSVDNKTPIFMEDTNYIGKYL